jgi:hypothetical protein
MGLNLESHSLLPLEKCDNLEQIAGMRIAGRA